MKHPAKKFKEQARSEIKELKELLRKSQEDCNFAKSILINTLHETRQFSAVISDKAQSLSQACGTDKRIKDLSDNIQYASGMLSSRLGFTEIEINPRSASKQIKYESVVYKKFDKARYLLSSIRLSNSIAIEFHGVSHMSIQTIPAFDMVPFVILHNAIKYSPRGYTVDVYYDQIDPDTLEVKVSSFGPPVAEEEIPLLFNREHRGINSDGYEGQGLGLYLAKRVCDFHGIGISISNGEYLNHAIGGKTFQKFIVNLHFEKLS